MLDQINLAELRPGCYCEIEMVVPLTASEGSFHCYKGTVKEITKEEVVLTGVLDESHVEYSGSGKTRPPTQDKRDVVNVPVTGIKEIWALPLKSNGPSRPAATSSVPPAKSGQLKLPSYGAHPGGARRRRVKHFV